MLRFDLTLRRSIEFLRRRVLEVCFQSTEMMTYSEIFSFSLVIRHFMQLRNLVVVIQELWRHWWLQAAIPTRATMFVCTTHTTESSISCDYKNIAFFV